MLSSFKHFWVGLKSRESTRRKVRDYLGGDVRGLRDVVRFTAECSNCSRMNVLLHQLRSHPHFEILMLRNKYVSPSALGYRDINITLGVKLDNGKRHICELQVNLSDMLLAKDMAHVLYEQVIHF